MNSRSDASNARGKKNPLEEALQRLLNRTPSSSAEEQGPSKSQAGGSTPSSEATQPPMNQDTPRCDEAERSCLNCDVRYVHIRVAEELERELSAKSAECEAWKEKCHAAWAKVDAENLAMRQEFSRAEAAERAASELRVERNAAREALSSLVELKRIKRKIESNVATDEQQRFYEGRKEHAWQEAERVIDAARSKP